MTEVYEVEDSKYIPSIMEVPSEDLLRMLNVLWEMEIKSRTLFQTGTEIVEFAEQLVSITLINMFILNLGTTLLPILLVLQNKLFTLLIKTYY